MAWTKPKILISLGVGSGVISFQIFDGPTRQIFSMGYLAHDRIIIVPAFDHLHWPGHKKMEREILAQKTPRKD